MQSKTFRFYKDEKGLWFIDLPEWTGLKSDLQMVLGADNMLDIIAQGDNTVSLYLSTEPFEGANILTWFTDGIPGDSSMGGGMYRLHQYKGIVFDLDMWLCDVTKFVFGEMPKLIYFIHVLLYP